MRHALNEPCPEAKIKNQFYSPCLESIPPKVIYFALKDAELACEKNYPKPEKCPVCGYKGNFSLFEVINQHRIFECPSCNLQFAYPMKAINYDKVYSKKVEDLLLYSDYEKTYEKYKLVLDEKEQIKRWSKLPRFNILLPILSILPKGKLFDVGCSTGYFMLIAKEKGFDVYGMETSEIAVKIAKEKFGLKIAQALTFDELPEEFKGPYKVVTAFEVLEHVEDPLNFLKNIYELLEENGFALISTPPYFKFENTALGYRKYKWWGVDYPPVHLTCWKPWTLFYALKLVGFSEIIIFTEPLLMGTILEGINPPDVEIKYPDGKNITLPKGTATAILLDTLKPFYLNSRILGNFQYAIAVKGKSNYDWEKIIKRSIRYSTVEIIWGKGN